MLRKAGNYGGENGFLVVWMLRKNQKIWRWEGNCNFRLCFQ